MFSPVESGYKVVISQNPELAPGTAAGSTLKYLYVKNTSTTYAPASDSHTGTRTDPYTTIEGAVKSVGEYETTGEIGGIILLSDINRLGSMYNIKDSTYGKNVTISSDSGRKYTINQQSGSTFSQWHLQDGGMSVAFMNVIVDSAKHTDGNYGEFFLGSGAVLTLGEGAELRNMTPRAVNIRAGGTLVMLPGSKITGCTAGKNVAFSDGYDGTENAGAAVYVCPNGAFDMRGGTITGNTATFGAAGVFGENGSSFLMSGTPVVSGNTKGRAPANVYLNDGQMITLTAPLTEGADVNVYVENMPTEGSPVQIATNAVSADAGYFHSDLSTKAGVGYKNDGIWLDYSLRAQPSTSIDRDGKGVISIYPTEPNTYYSILDKDGALVDQSTVKANSYDENGVEIPLTWTVKGWASQDGAALASGGTIIFKPVLPGQEYIVVKTSDADNSTPTDDAVKTAGEKATVPVVGSNVSAEPDGEGKFSILVNPSDPAVKYNVVDKDGKVVGGAWQQGSGGEIDLSFPGMTAGGSYKIVAVPATETNPPSQVTGGDAVKLPSAGVEAVDPGSITRTEGGDGKDKIVLSPVKSAQEYGVRDPETGDITWKKGSEAVGGALTFDGLDPDKTYEVLTREPGTLPLSGVSVSPAVDRMTLNGRVLDAEGNPVPNAAVKVVVKDKDGYSKTITATTGPDGRYTLESDGVATGTYQLYVESGKGNVSAPVTVSSTQPQDMGDTKVDPAVASIMGGAVTKSDGKPASGTVTVVDKNTGLALSPQPEGTLTLTPGGGYVIENLPEGTYIIQTSGGGNSGMTEVKVGADGSVVPNRDGGYKTTDLTSTPGSIVSGFVEGLAPGETAKVTIAVPVYDDDGVTVIGAKNVTAQAEGPSGYYQFAGVPDGDYPVGVTGPDGKVATDTIAVSGDTKQNLTLPAEKPAKPGSIVSGIVMDEDGVPVKGAPVTIYDKDGSKVSPTVPAAITTGEGGGWTVEGLDPAMGPYHASVDTDGTNGVAGPIQVNSDGSVEGKTNMELSGKADGSGLTGNTAGKLLTGVVKDKDGKPVSGATVVVKNKDGNVVGTTTTNSSGAYFVSNVPDSAAVTVIAKDGQTGSANVGSGNPLNGGVSVAPTASNTLAVVGPEGGVLNVAASESATAAKVSVTGPKPAAGDVTGIFDIVDGKLTVKADTPDGSYTVTLEQNGMKVQKEITVKGGVIVSGSPFTVDTHTVSGKLDYAVGAIPGDATVAITSPDGSYTWGESKVNPNTGRYEISDIPDGVYAVKVTVTDPDTGDKTVVDGALTMTNGVPSYSFTPAGNGATVTQGANGLSVQPSDAIRSVNGLIDAALAESGDLDAVKAALDALNGLSAEQGKQVAPNQVTALSGKLAALLDKLSLAAKAENVGGKAEGQLTNQSALLLDNGEIESAKTNTVDVQLTLKAENVTDAPPARDKNKVEAAARGGEVGAYFDVSIRKDVTVKDGDGNTVSTSSGTVPQVPQPITITLTIPEDIRGYDYYNVIRVHDGSAARIPSTATKTEITFSSSLYSTYAVIYSDEPIFGDEVKVSEPSRPSYSGSGGGSAASPSVKVEQTAGGTVTVSPVSAVKGDKVTITVRPDAGNMVDKVVVLDKNGKEVAVTDNGDGTYSYIQPEDGVTVKATFKAVTGNPYENGVSDWLNVDDHTAYLKGSDLGAFNPGANMTRAEAAQMFYNLLNAGKKSGMNGSAGFTDVPADAWYADTVNTLANLGIFHGRGEGVFAPNDPITRAEFVSIMTRFAVKASGTSHFSDVTDGYWAYDAVNSAAQYGWVNGYEDGTFRPMSLIARSEAAAAVNRMLWRSADAAFVAANADSLKTFPDVAKDYWAYADVMEAANTHGHTSDNGVETWTK